MNHQLLPVAQFINKFSRISREPESDELGNWVHIFFRFAKGVGGGRGKYLTRVWDLDMRRIRTLNPKRRRIPPFCSDDEEEEESPNVVVKKNPPLL